MKFCWLNVQIQIQFQMNSFRFRWSILDFPLAKTGHPLSVSYKTDHPTQLVTYSIFQYCFLLKCNKQIQNTHLFYSKTHSYRVKTFGPCKTKIAAISAISMWYLMGNPCWRRLEILMSRKCSAPGHEHGYSRLI